MSDQTPNLSLPFIMPAQAQKHVTHNEAIELLDMIVQLTLEATNETTPPSSPAEGQAWAIGINAGGEWIGHDGKIATWRGGGWLFVEPNDGWLAWVRNAAELQVLTDGAWVTKGEPVMQNLPNLGINSTADDTNRLTVSSTATLLNNDGGGHQVKVNKAAPSDTASLIYQTGFSGRAEMGLVGNDDFSIKVSPDGSNFTTSLTISAANGHVTVGEVMNVSPGSAPVSPITGDVYYDDTLNKLRCFDGSAWRNLF